MSEKKLCDLRPCPGGRDCTLNHSKNRKPQGQQPLGWAKIFKNRSLTSPYNCVCVCMCVCVCRDVVSLCSAGVGEDFVLHVYQIVPPRKKIGSLTTNDEKLKNILLCEKSDSLQQSPVRLSLIILFCYTFS